jgi:hypothetical protein
MWDSLWGLVLLWRDPREHEAATILSTLVESGIKDRRQLIGELVEQFGFDPQDAVTFHARWQNGRRA